MSRTELATALIDRSTSQRAIASAPYAADAACDLATLCDDWRDFGVVVQYRGQTDDGAEWTVDLHKVGA